MMMRKKLAALSRLTATTMTATTMTATMMTATMLAPSGRTAIKVSATVLKVAILATHNRVVAATTKVDALPALVPN
jgi:hypothetical protein